MSIVVEIFPKSFSKKFFNNSWVLIQSLFMPHFALIFHYSDSERLWAKLDFTSLRFYKINFTALLKKTIEKWFMLVFFFQNKNNFNNNNKIKKKLGEKT